jgi:UDP-galactopyranose mutase
MYDYVIVGAGLFGATFANLATEAGKSCLVIDKRNHIAGNCYTEEVEGIHVHKYGPHIFHTNSPVVWAFVNSFANFNHFSYRPLVSYQSHLYSFPINMTTLYQLWSVRTPAEAEQVLQSRRIPCEDPKNLKEWVLSQVGAEIYDIFIRGYTTKQWGRDPSELPASIIRRLPIRLTYDTNYFNDRYQGIPYQGYTRMVERMLQGSEVQLEVDWFQDQRLLRRLCKNVVYSGPLDQFFDYQCGPLEYRSLRFEEEWHDGDFQGVAGVNYTDAAVPYTRIVEHKHFTFNTGPRTIITREYPSATGEPFYPVNDEANNARRSQYLALPEQSGVIFGGRLGTYQYYDMHQVIAQAIATFKRLHPDSRVAQKIGLPV